LLLCHGMVCVVGRMRDLILQLSKSSIYSTKPVSCAMYFHLYLVMNKDCIGNTTEEVTYGRLVDCPDTDCQPYSWSCYLH
ncbi:hypothetical protein KKZ88_21675, partial [Enterobacter roggenkampii]|nr:hypothetical protein [Enterobacter roggenkampii]